MNNQYSTSVLMDVLKSADFQDIPQYSQAYLNDVNISFAAYMDELLLKKKLKRQDVLQKADIPQKYGYKLLTGERHTTDRDKLLRIFFAMHLTLKEARRGLELYKMPALYPKRRRDAILIIAFNKGYSSVDDVNKILSDHGEAELNRCRE